MNFIDVLIVVLIIAAVARGVNSGLLREAGSLGGFVAGIVLAAAATPLINQVLPGTTERPILLLGIFFGIALALSGIGESLGIAGAKLAERWKLGPLDGILGAAFGVVATLCAVWLLAATFGRSGGPVFSAGIADSRILTTLDKVLPPAPEVTAKLERVLGTANFPRVFAGLEPAPAAPVTGPNAATVNAAVAAARAATVKIEGAGCGGILDGSGFVAGQNLVITNAHVVAGIARPNIIDAAGTHRATVVSFDPNLDIAVLRATGLAAAPLNLASVNQPRGTVGAALGYPGGGPFTAGSAAILQRQTAVGRNIYDAGLVRRDIYVLQAIVRPGNSGGPLVTADGTVIGVIFATSTTNSNVGYALTSTEVIPELHQVSAASGAVSSGQCAAD